MIRAVIAARYRKQDNYSALPPGPEDTGDGPEGLEIYSRASGPSRKLAKMSNLLFHTRIAGRLENLFDIKKNEYGGMYDKSRISIL